MEYREIADMGFEDGWNVALSEVSKLVHELHASGETEIATAIFERAWKRLDEGLEPALAERRARRAARDEHAARLAAKQQS